MTTHKLETAEVYYYDGGEGQYELLTSITGELPSAAMQPPRRRRAVAI